MPEAPTESSLPAKNLKKMSASAGLSRIAPFKDEQKRA
jgi:hypothetical protein